MSEPPRFYVRESTGYLTARGGGSGSRAFTEVMVLDRAYCHRVVWTSAHAVERVLHVRASGRREWYDRTFRRLPVARSRERAAELAALWNAEDKALCDAV